MAILLSPTKQGFQVVATSVQGNIAIKSAVDSIFALQYHPEVTHSEKGTETLDYFLLKVCGITADWKLENVKGDEIEKVKKMVRPDYHVIYAISGGVDLTKAATLVHQAIGDRLHCVFADNDLCRYKERERIMSTFEKDLHLPVTCVDASEQFLSKLKGVVDPERKLKICAMGKLLGVPASFVSRHPFPGPGLAVQIMGDVTQDNALETIRLADEIFINGSREAGLYDEIWQAFVVYFPVKTVGVLGG